MTDSYNPDVYHLATTAQLNEQKLTVAEVARILRVSKMTVYRLTKAEPGLPAALRSYRVGRGNQKQIRIPLSAVRAYLGEAEMDGVA